MREAAARASPEVLRLDLMDTRWKFTGHASTASDQLSPVKYTASKQEFVPAMVKLGGASYSLESRIHAVTHAPSLPSSRYSVEPAGQTTSTSHINVFKLMGEKSGLGRKSQIASEPT